MTRSIKFRAWDKVTSEWVAFDQPPVHSVGGRKTIGVLRGSDDSVVFMQWTGLKDTNGVEIYEGDVVSGQGDSIERRLYQIVWSDKEASFWAKLLTADYDSLQKFIVGQNFSTGVATQVIGNIYANPDLLETA